MQAHPRRTRESATQRRAGTARAPRAGRIPLVARGLLAAVLLAATALRGEAGQNAPAAQLQVAQGPWYAGVPIDLQVVADGFEEEPTPEVQVTAPAGATLAFVQARPQVSSMVQIVNGRMTQSHTVRFAFVYQLAAAAPGRIELGPFTVVQGDRRATTRSISLDVIGMPEAKDQRVRLVTPKGPVYLGQRIPVTVEWWTEEGLADRLYNERLRVPLFLDSRSFQFVDPERQPSRVAVSVELPSGLADVPVDVQQREENGKRWVVRSFSRTMVPLVAGHFEPEAPSLLCEEAVRFQRDLFGSRVPSQTRRLRVPGEATPLDVQAVPAAGRPATFAGAIGQGFVLEVTADRSVLQAGDPLKLVFSVRGDGSLETASLPPLAAAGLDPAHFHLPDGDTAGIVDGNTKRFEVQVRVLDPSVREIPPLAWSWFDPSTARFETARSAPIALSVRAGTVVGAADVVSAAPAEPAPAASGGNGASRTAQAAAGTATQGLSLTGADLSMETDPARLRPTAPPLLASAWFARSAYALGIVALLGGVGLGRQRRKDPVATQRRKHLRALRAEVAAATSARACADALRRMAAASSDAPGAAPMLDALLAALDESAFAPGAGAAGLGEERRQQALAAADALLGDER